MPFRLTNCPATFQKMMVKILLSVNDLRFYVDGVVILLKNAEEHAMNQGCAFRVLKDYGLRLRIKKFSFMQPSVGQVENIVDENVIYADDGKLEKVRDATFPTTSKKFV